MTERGPDFSRVERKKGRNRTNRMLNILIAVVVLLIIITASLIFTGNDDNQTADEKEVANTEKTNDDSDSEDTGTAVVDDEDEDNASNGEENDSESTTVNESGETEDPDASEDGKDDEGAGMVTYGPSDDKVVAETVVNAAWKPIGTTQTGDHVSLYDGSSVDWNEKKQALAYATGLSQDSMIFWKIKNGGGPQKSVGIVSSKDSSEKYRVYLEWIDGQGWKPVKMDKLTTLDFDY
ncbi:MAG: DUF1510 family protein [Sporosarcina sp.]